MINLLFITNNPRAEQVCGYFRQQLKVRIDLVSDFDHGLKAVFEQRPSVVCIQEQIASVTGESVARHIQMLLGADAPAFVLLHEGNSKVKPVPRLFEHLVDLGAPFEQVSSNLCQALQQLLANYPELLCPTTLPAVVAESAVIPVERSEEVASVWKTAITAAPPQEQKQIDEFSDLFESTIIGGPPAERPTPAVPQQVPSEPALMQQVKPGSADDQQPEQPQVNVPPPLLQPVTARIVAPVARAADQISPAADDDTVPVEELLQAVEESYLRRKRLLWVSLVGVLLLVVAVAVWWFRYRVPSAALTPATPPAASSAVMVPKPVLQQPASSAAGSPSPPRQETLPSFVATAKSDPAFGAVQPGWSRYLTDHREYRLFHENNRLQAVQVLARGGNGIAAAEIRQVLQELTGSDQYQVKPPSRKQEGVWVEEAAARSGGAGLLIYRTAPRGPVSAFVIARTP